MSRSRPCPGDGPIGCLEGTAPPRRFVPGTTVLAPKPRAGLSPLNAGVAASRSAAPASARRRICSPKPPVAEDFPEDKALGQAGGFSLHAGVAAGAKERRKLERLCRYISRPALARTRLSLTPSGKVRYHFKTPWRDGTTHVVFEPLDFIARLAALVPKPRVNLTRFHGVFAPNSRYRACGASSESISSAAPAAGGRYGSSPASRTGRGREKILAHRRHASHSDSSGSGVSEARGPPYCIKRA